METEVPQHLSTDILKTAQFIKDLLALVNGQRRSLKEKVCIVKSQIQDDISLHLELLRNREVWLLEQVDLLAQLKEESIEKHQTELCGLLAKLEVYLDLLQTEKLGYRSEIAVEVGKVVSSIQNASMDVEGSPDINFIVNNFSLSDAIKSFGNIAEDVPVAQKSAGQKKTRMLNQSGAKDVVFVREYFTNLSISPACNWLVPASRLMNESASSVTNASSDVIGEFYNKLKQSDVRDWLRREDQPMDLKATTNSFVLHFQEVKEAPMTDWVQSSVTDHSNDETTTCIRFDASEALDTWLLTSEVLSRSSDERNTVDEKTPVGKMNNDNAGGTGWLLTSRNMDEDDDTSPKKREEKTQSDNWLLSMDCTQPGNEPLTQDENWLQRFRESMGKSTSDWLIVADDVEPEYCEWLTRESIDRCKNCPGECARDTFQVFRKVINSSMNEWLTTATDW